MKQHWSGVFPAVTTQFRGDLSLDIDASARVMERPYALGRLPEEPRRSLLFGH